MFYGVRRYYLTIDDGIRYEGELLLIILCVTMFGINNGNLGNLFDYISKRRVIMKVNGMVQDIALKLLKHSMRPLGGPLMSTPQVNIPSPLSLSYSHSLLY